MFVILSNLIHWYWLKKTNKQTNKKPLNLFKLQFKPAIGNQPTMAQYNTCKSSIFWNSVRLPMLLKHLERFHRVTQGIATFLPKVSEWESLREILQVIMVMHNQISYCMTMVGCSLEMWTCTGLLTYRAYRSQFRIKLLNLKEYSVILPSLWHKSEDTNKNRLFLKFHLILILHLHVMHDYVHWLCSIDYCIK